MKKDYFLKGFVILLFFLFSDFGFGQTYCMPTTTYYYYQVYITNVALSGETTPPANTSSYLLGYQDFTGLTPKCEQYPGKDVAVTVTPSMNSRIKSWVDWNKDGDFIDAGEQVYDSGGATASGAFNVSIPPETLPGDYRIRVRNLRRDTYYPTLFSDYPDFTACENFHYIYIIWVDWKGSYGEAEDYSITVLDCKKEWTGAVDNNWTTAGNWLPSGVPTENHCVEASSDTIIVNDNGNAKSVTLMGESNLTITSGNTLTVENVINTSATSGIFLMENNASILQDSLAVNIGDVRVVREAEPMKRYDFTYWSSPVAGQTLYNLSPITLFNKYYSWNPINPNIGWVIHNYGAVTMEAGKGYIVRAPQNFPINTVNPVNFVGEFTGILHNGEKTVPEFQGSDSEEVWNLIGNPYPSPIDIDLFLTDPDNTEVGGTIYLWTHNTPPVDGGSGTYTYIAHDYASYNLTGGVATALSATSDTDSENVLTNGHIASGQSFFIRGIVDGAGTVKFKNSMRIAGNNANFFKPGPTTPVENWEMTGKHRFWLNLTNAQGAFNQALIGYVQNATNELDRLYDGEVFGGNYVTIYSLLEQNKLTIQGRALPFTSQDLVPLGYKATIAGTFNISLDHYDSFFEGQDVFLKDNLLNTIQNLKEGDYSFASDIGTFDARFEIVYVNEPLGVEDPEINPESIIIYKNTHSDIVVNAGLLNLDEVKVYDIAGRLLYQEKNINTTETLIKNLPATQQVLVAEVLTTEGFKIAKKVIL